MSGGRIVTTNKLLIMKNSVLFLAFCVLFLHKTYCQKDTLDALWGKVITDNEQLINYSNELSQLDKCNPASSIEAFNIYKQLFKDDLSRTKDTALLMYIYFSDFFIYETECVNSILLEVYTEKDNSPSDSLIRIINNQKLNKYGFELITISHGDIAISVLPGFVESLFKDDVRKEIRSFLHYWTVSEKALEKGCSQGTCSEFVKLKGQRVSLLEDYFNSNNTFLVERLKYDYYSNLIFFAIGNNLELNQYYSSFHIKDSNLEDVFNEFITINPNSKATWFIKTLKETINDLDDEESDRLLNQFLSFKCIEKEDYPCNEELYNYDYFEKNVIEIIKCYKDGECF